MSIPEQKKTKPEWLPLILLLVIVGLGTGLRLFQIGNKGLWLDEAFSVWLGWHSLSEILSWVVRIDQHPPLYYFLLHFWMALGDSALIVRSFSALMGVLTIPIMYLLGRRLMGRNGGLLAAMILAISPFHVRFAQETRMYTLLTLNATLALLALTYLLTDPQTRQLRLGRQLLDLYRTRRRTDPVSNNSPKVPFFQTIKTDLAWLGYIFFSAATILTHNTAIFFPIAVNLFVFGLIIIRGRRPWREGQLSPPSLKNWISAQLGLLLLWSPWLVPFIIQSVGVYREFWLSPPDYKTVIWTITNLMSVFLPGQIQGQFEWTDVVWFGFGTIVLLGLVKLRRQPAHQLLLLTLFLTPFVGEWLVSLRRPIFYDRTLIWTSIPLYLLLAAGLTQLRYRPLILLTVMALLTVNTLSLREYFFEFNKEQWDDAATYVAQNVEDTDLLLFNATWVQIPFDFYFRDFKRPVKKHGIPVDLFDRGILEPKMTTGDLPRLRELVRDRERVWLIYSHNWYTDAQSLIPTALEEDFKILDQRQFYGLEVRLYGAP